MRHTAVLLVLVFFAALTAGAQSSASNAVPNSSLALDPAPSALFAVRLTPFDLSPAPVPAPSTVPSLAPSTPLLNLAPAPAPQDVTSVFQNYSWQLYLGYTYTRFYEIPAFSESTNGFDIDMVYYFKDWVGAEGDLSAVHGTQFGNPGVSSWLATGSGGARFRWSARRGLELWAHALAGYSHFTPQTAYGSQQAFAYTLGGGVDLPFKPRWALRFGADVLGTRYFSTHQFSPKFSAGIVFRY